MKKINFKNEKQIFCGLCGKNIINETEIEDELCNECLKSLLDDEDE